MPLGTEVCLGLRHIVSHGDPGPLPKKGVEPPIFGQCPLWSTAGWTKMPLGMEVGLGPGDFVFDGDPASPERMAQPPPNFWPVSIVAKRLDGPRCHLVRRSTSAQATLCQMGSQLPLKGAHPQFLVHVYCGQTGGWMKTPLGTEVDLGPGLIALDGDPAPREMGTAAPRLFSAHVYCGYGCPSVAELLLHFA